MIRDKWNEVLAGRLLSAMRKVLEELGDDAGRVVALINMDETGIFPKKIAKFMVEQVDNKTYNIVETDPFVITDDGTKATSQLVQDLRDLGIKVNVYREEHLDTDFPAPKEATTRRFKKAVEADPEHASKSANMCDKAGIAGITLRECLIMERVYFQETGNHLDPKTWTICAGSRYPDGHVPHMYWSPVRSALCVRWCHPDDRYSHARVREAV